MALSRAHPLCKRASLTKCTNLTKRPTLIFLFSFLLAWSHTLPTLEQSHSRATSPFPNPTLTRTCYQLTIAGLEER